jgi:hypothetical protein
MSVSVCVRVCALVDTWILYAEHDVDKLFSRSLFSHLQFFSYLLFKISIAKFHSFHFIFLRHYR